MLFLEFSWIFPREDAHYRVAPVFEGGVTLFDFDYWKPPDLTAPIDKLCRRKMADYCSLSFVPK
jgi:hypothetical protein